MNQDLHASFIKYSKAFYKVRHRFINVLLKKKIDPIDIRIILNVYEGQKYKFREVFVKDVSFHKSTLICTQRI